MPIRSITAVFNGTEPERPMLDVACELAIKHQAQLKVLHVLPDPQVYEGFYTGQTIVVSLEEENEQRMEEAKRHFKAVTGRYSIPVLGEKEQPPLRHPSICFVHRTGMTERVVAEEGRFSDLIVMHCMAGGVTSNAYEGALTAALFATTCPLLMVPDGKPKLPLDHTVAIAWKNSKEAARAMHEALPFITQAEKVYVLIAHPSGEPIDLDDKERILTYLALHGAEAQVILVDGKEEDTGSLLLSRAKDLKAGLLVMGGYGRSRFREIILGGVTEHVLNHADLPVLMAH